MAKIEVIAQVAAMKGRDIPVMVIPDVASAPPPGPGLTEEEKCALSCFMPNLATVIEREPPSHVEETRKRAQEELAILLRLEHSKTRRIAELEAANATLQQTLKDWAPFVPGHCLKCKRPCSSNGCTRAECREGTG